MPTFQDPAAPVLDAMLDRLPLDLARRIRDSLQRQALLGEKTTTARCSRPTSPSSGST